MKKGPQCRRTGQSHHRHPRGSAEQTRQPGSSEYLLVLQQKLLLSEAGGLATSHSLPLTEGEHSVFRANFRGTEGWAAQPQPLSAVPASWTHWLAEAAHSWKLQGRPLPPVDSGTSADWWIENWPHWALHPAPAVYLGCYLPGTPYGLWSLAKLWG